MRRLNWFIGIAVLAVNCNLAQADDQQASTEHQKASEILTCVRDIYQNTAFEDFEKVPLKSLEDILHQTTATKNDLGPLLSQCKTIQAELATKGLIAPLLGMFQLNSTMVKKQKLWTESIYAMDRIVGDGAYTLLRIINPEEKCTTEFLHGVGFIVAAGVSGQSCLNSAGYSYYKVDASAGAVLAAGCMAVGYIKKINLSTYQRPDDWSYVLGK